MDNLLKRNFDKNNALYNKTEDIYRKYHEVADNKEQLLSYYESLDFNYVFTHVLYIPGYTPPPPAHLTDDIFTHKDINVDIKKHACYLPCFLHDHTFYEICYVADGTAKHIVGDVIVEMEAGDIFIVPPLVTHSLEVYSKSIVVNIIVKKNFMENIFMSYNSNKNPLFDFLLASLFESHTNSCLICRTQKDSFCYNLLELLFAENQKDNRNSMCFSLNEKLFNTFLLYIAEHFSNNVTVIHPSNSISTDNVLPNILFYIKNHYKSVTLDDLAILFHYSTDHVSKLIKMKTGKNFVALRTEYRMEAARNLLANTNLSIKKIGESVGYNKAEQFNKAYKKMFHITPSVYRAGNLQ